MISLAKPIPTYEQLRSRAAAGSRKAQAELKARQTASLREQMGVKA